MKPDKVKYKPGSGPILYWLPEVETKYGNKSTMVHVSTWTITVRYFPLAIFIIPVKLIELAAFKVAAMFELSQHLRLLSLCT